MLRTHQIYRDTTLIVSVVESVEFWHSQTAKFCQATGKIEALAVVVNGPRDEYALDMNAKPMDKKSLSRLLAAARPGNLTK